MRRKTNSAPTFVFLLGLLALTALATSASTVVGTITPRMQASGANGPSNFTPNQIPNSVESDSARQTRYPQCAQKNLFLDIRRATRAKRDRASLIASSLTFQLFLPLPEAVSEHGCCCYRFLASQVL
jgi:hypothetical protein